MRESMTAVLLRLAYSHAVPPGTAAVVAAAILAGWNEQRHVIVARELFSEFANRLPEDDHGSGLTAARDWLRDPGLSFNEWRWVEESLSFLRAKNAPIDWSAELADCLTSDMRGGIGGLSLPLARSLARVVDLPTHGSIGCFFNATASVAWVLAEERDVTLYVDQQAAIIVALFARAACRQLTVRRENPLDGSFMPAPYGQPSLERASNLPVFDYVVSNPPFGMRVEDGPAKGMPFESYQLHMLASRARRSFMTIVPDGILFRETRAEAQLREEVVTQNHVTVLSLPSGMFWPATSVSSSILRLEKKLEPSVRVIDGRAMEKSSSGRAQEGLIVQHLESFRGFRTDDPARGAVVSIDELAQNGFSLLPGRYVKSTAATAIERALEQRPVVALGDIAEIERGKAPLPIREIDEDPPLTAMEIAPADLIGGIVRKPTRQQAFGLKEQERVHGVTVRPGDILVSIKGNVGNIGIIDDLEAILAEQMGDPWIVSQSLAIIRLKPGGPIRSAAVLNALLTAPWVRDKLESMSGATTVRTLPMNALRSLALPIPSPDECDEAESALAEIATVRDRISHHQQTLAEQQRQLWAQLWHVPATLGDE
jgi:type I restriction-modification system DNA methylase subunit